MLFGMSGGREFYAAAIVAAADFPPTILGCEFTGELPEWD
jgi:hypothetical protein